MLPRALSEDLVSLGPDVPRRAMVFDMTLDSEGVCTKTEIVQARVRSRHKLTYADVAAAQVGAESPVSDPAIVQSLQTMKAVGGVRTRLADARGVVPYHRKEVRVKLQQGEDAGLTAVEVVRNGVEADNAQLSLLCNAQGAEVLRTLGKEHAQPIYKVHPPPGKPALEALVERLDAVAGWRNPDPRQPCGRPSGRCGRRSRPAPRRRRPLGAGPRVVLSPRRARWTTGS